MPPPASRRTFSRRALGAGLTACLGQAAARRRPNILVYITDDESWLERRPYGWSTLATPHFERVAREGVLFTHAYTSAPSCAPSRAALLTGRNFWELEQGAFIQAWLPARFATLPDLMEAGGYHAGFTGKGWGPGVLGPSGRRRNPAGEAYNRARRTVQEEGINPIDYAANFEDFLSRRPAGKPFWFWAGSGEPHDPHGPDNYRKLARYGLGPGALKLPPYLPDTPAERRARDNFAYEVRHADEDLGRILKILQDSGELSHTLLIVTADNGTAIPRAKTNVYDWGVRVPLAVMWPDRIKPGRRAGGFVNFIDLAPTMLQAAGLPTPAEMSGQGLLEVFASARARTRSWTAAGLEWHGEFDPVSFAARMIRDERYQYIVNYGTRPTDYPGPAGPSAPRPREELYDCEQDPWQLNDLSGSPRHAAIRQSLRARLEAYQLRTRDPRATGEMAVFEQTRQYVQQRKRDGYKEA
jgi:uncharacterized sulfatase